MVVYTPSADRILHTTTADFSNRMVSKSVHIVQYDAGIPILAVSLCLDGTQYTLPSSAEANIRFSKKDGTFVYNPALGCSADRHTVYFEITQQMTAQHGRFSPIVEIVMNGDVAGSSYLNIEIDRNPVQEGDIESTTEFTTIQDVADRAEAALDGAENVNISATQTPTGADITVTNREGVETTVHVDTLLAVNTWEDVRNAVRLGYGETLFPAGYEFTTHDSDTDRDIIWAVRAHDHHTAANSRLTHTMTLETKYVYSLSSGSWQSLQFDQQEALYYAEEGLAAGTYNFTAANQAWYEADNGKTFQFTLAQPVPAGGQIDVAVTNNQTLDGKNIKTYASPSSAAAIETATITEGSAGTSLGATDGSGNMNWIRRIAFGSNNYAQSATRQWLNSAAAAGSVWTPQTKYDRPPSWATTYNGFLHGLPSDFLAVVEPAVIPCRTNSLSETNSLDGTEFTINQVYNLKDKFFLLSKPEIFGTWDSTAYKDGELLDYYDGLTNTERKKYDNGGNARDAWSRSPVPPYANLEYIISAGLLTNYNTNASLGVTPACIIA